MDHKRQEARFLFLTQSSRRRHLGRFLASMFFHLLSVFEHKPCHSFSARNVGKVGRYWSFSLSSPFDKRDLGSSTERVSQPKQNFSDLVLSPFFRTGSEQKLEL